MGIYYENFFCLLCQKVFALFKTAGIPPKIQAFMLSLIVSLENTLISLKSFFEHVQSVYYYIPK